MSGFSSWINTVYNGATMLSESEPPDPESHGIVRKTLESSDRATIAGLDR